jgi:hypothetical protein
MNAPTTRRLTALALAAVIVGCASTKGPEPGKPTTGPVATTDAAAGTLATTDAAKPSDPAQGKEAGGFSEAGPADVLRPVAPGEEPGGGKALPPPPPPVSVGPGPGQLAQLMPQDCRTRVYANVAGLLGSDGPALSASLDQIVQTADPSGQVAGALRALRDGGYDPVLSLREIAYCDHPELALVRLQPSHPGDVLATLQHAFAAVGEKGGAVRPWGSMRVLADASGGPMLVDVAPNVLLVADHASDAANALGARAGGPGFTGSERQLIWVQDREADLAVAEKAGLFDVQVSVHSREAAGDKAAQGKLVADLQKDLRKAADKLAKTPLAPIGAKLRAAKVSAAGNDILIHGSISRAELSKLAKSLSALKPDALKSVLKGL